MNTATELAAAGEEAAAVVRDMFDRTEGAFLAAIEEGQRSGEIDPARDARALASLLLNTVSGCASWPGPRTAPSSCAGSSRRRGRVNRRARMGR